MGTSLVQVRVDDDVKAQAAAIYEELGIDISTAVRMFLKRTIIENGLPFSMILPRPEYKAHEAVLAMEEISRQARQNGTSEMTLEEINAEIEAVRRGK